MTSGFHYGEAPIDLLGYSQKLVQLNDELNKSDPIVFFYHLLFLFLAKKRRKFNSLLESIGEAHFDTSNKSLLHFVEALLLIDELELERAYSIFDDLTYSGHFYLEIWSRLFCIVIQLKLGNVYLAQSLMSRIRNFIKKYAYRSYTKDSTSYCLKIIQQRMNKRRMKIKEPIHLTELHKFLLTVLNE